ncbi:hypothetical protein CEP52_013080 [Fusarium oligoseptatum]|uniref:Uncharacterized protein n=2 Tax=Fusarium solani species complex TaxID=232080 RepID=A0A428SVA1_9HYPO|nr:hypothetical protein CEP51_003502 [Fusarium floridanum]RSL93714.1 hypothetical protein CEP52_013080 [Fusarium oligoseptatum]
MCAQRTSEWLGFSTWTKFQAEPGPIDEIIFDPLYTWSDSISTPAYGRITESPQDYILSLDWNSPEAYQEFKASPEYQQLMTNLRINSTEAHTQIIIFENYSFGSTSTPNTEILTVYWPLSLSPETQNAIWDVEPLVHTPVSETLGRRCYKQPPAAGWIDGPQIWNGDTAVASVWVHDWKSEALEDRFKRTEKRVVSMGRDVIYPLAVDDFEKRLLDLGALGWESVHVLFEDLNWIYDDEIKRYHLITRVGFPSVISSSSQVLNVSGRGDTALTVVVDSGHQGTSVLSATGDDLESTAPAMATRVDDEVAIIATSTE